MVGLAACPVNACDMWPLCKALAFIKSQYPFSKSQSNNVHHIRYLHVINCVSCDLARSRTCTAPRLLVKLAYPITLCSVGVRNFRSAMCSLHALSLAWADAGA